MKELLRVLVVDDEPQLTCVLQMVLKAEGYRVRTAANGVAALAAFDEWNPDLIVTDLRMPLMDGIELCRRIRHVSTVPILALSAEPEACARTHALEAGADDYLAKPIGLVELLTRVRDILGRGHGQAA